MNAFEENIKVEILEMSQRINDAKYRGNFDELIQARATLNGYLKGLKACLNSNYVDTFMEYVKNYYRTH